MLITIDKRGSINIPLAIRRSLGLKQGSNLELCVEEGGQITLHPVAIYRTTRLGDSGLAKLKAARESGEAALPDWLRKDMIDASLNSDQ